MELKVMGLDMSCSAWGSKFAIKKRSLSREKQRLKEWETQISKKEKVIQQKKKKRAKSKNV